jgi:hypothetical protein
MHRARLTLAISVVGLLVSFTGILVNEGIVSFGPEREPTEGFRSLYVWRAACKPPVRRERDSAIVYASSRPAKHEYFSKRFGGTLKLSFPSFFSGCSRFAVDLSELPEASLVNAEFWFFRDSDRSWKGPPGIEKLDDATTVERSGDGIYVISARPGLRAAALDLEVDGLFERVGAAELEIDLRVAFLERVEDGMSRASRNHPTNLFGVDVAEFIAIAPSQRQSIPNLGRLGNRAQVVRIVWFGALDSMNRLLSLLLSTLLGIWIGGIFESVLVLATVKEIRRTTEPAALGVQEADPRPPAREAEKPPSPGLQSAAGPSADPETEGEEE